MNLKVFEVAILLQSGVVLAQGLFPGTSIFEPLFPTAVSEFVGACPASETIGSGFNVEARICSDAHHYSSSDNLGVLPFTGQVDNSNGAGDNKGLPPYWYIPTTFVDARMAMRELV